MRDTYIRDSEVCCFDRSPRLTHLYLEHPQSLPKNHHPLDMFDDSDGDKDKPSTSKRKIKRKSYNLRADHHSIGSVIVVGLSNMTEDVPVFELMSVGESHEHHRRLMNPCNIEYITGRRRRPRHNGLKIAIEHIECDMNPELANTIHIGNVEPGPSGRQQKNKNLTTTSDKEINSDELECTSRHDSSKPLSLERIFRISSDSKESKPGTSGEQSSSENDFHSVSKCNKNEAGPSGISRSMGNTVINIEKILTMPGSSGMRNKGKRKKTLKSYLKRRVKPKSNRLSDSESDVDADSDFDSESETDFQTSEDEDFIGFPDEQPYNEPRNNHDILESDDCLLVSDLSVINFCPRLNPEENDHNETLFFIRICAGPELKREEPCKLHTLTLRHFKGISDRSLLHLAKVPSLRYLDVTGTSVSRVGVDRFMIVRPEVKLISNFSDEIINENLV